MTLLIDTSAFYALLSEDDLQHERAVEILRRIGQRGEEIVTTNYVLLETSALVGRRLGIEGVRTFQTALVPIAAIVWVDESTHERAMAALLTTGLRDLSLVDCVSFEVMRLMAIDRAFAFDPHFEWQGFTCL